MADSKIANDVSWRKGTSVARPLGEGRYLMTRTRPVAVPDLIGLTPVNAAFAIAEAGLSLGEYEDRPDFVTAQDPAPGTLVDPGTPVSFETT